MAGVMKVLAGVTVSGDCPIRLCPEDGDQITFVFGEGVEAFEITMDFGFLSRFRDTAADVLAGS